MTDRRFHSTPRRGRRRFRAGFRLVLERFEPRWALAAFTVGPLTFDVLQAGSAVVTDCDPAATTADIPSVVTDPDSGLPLAVEQIGYEAFADCQSLTSVTIPGSVTSIAIGAFRDCTALTSIAVPGSVERVACETFLGCTSLINVSLAEGVKEIDGDFYGGIPREPYLLFLGAFIGCTALTSIALPASLTRVDVDAFAGTGLGRIDVAPGNASYASLDGILVDRGVVKVIWCPEGWKGAVVLPETVTSIRGGAFSDCDGITSITIPGSIKEIPSGAFAGCDGLQSVVIESGVEEIGGVYSESISPFLSAYGAFAGCSALKSISIPGSVKRIGQGAFADCDGLTTVVLSQGVERIGEFSGGGASVGIGAFSGCTSLVTVTIPVGVKSIGAWAFKGCAALASVTIPRGTTSIGMQVFEGCTGLKSVFFVGAPPVVSGVLGTGVKATAFYAAGNRAWARYAGKMFAGLRTRAARLSAAPTMPVAVNASGGVRVQWRAPVATGGAPVVDYVVQVSRTNGKTWSTVDEGVSASNSASVTGLERGRRYVFRVAAVTFVGRGAFTANTKAVVFRDV